GLALERHARALDLEHRPLVARVEFEPAADRTGGEPGAHVVDAQEGGHGDLEPARDEARTRRRGVTGGLAERRGERRADARVAIRVLEPAHATGRRAGEVLEPPAGPARLVRRDLHVDRAERHGVAVALDRHLPAGRGLEAAGQAAVVEMARDLYARVEGVEW